MKRIKLSIKKGDTIQVISGSQKGTKAAVLEVDRKNLRVKAQGVRMQTHYSRQDGIQTREGYIDYSNVKLVQGAAATEAKAPAKAKKKTSKKS